MNNDFDQVFFFLKTKTYLYPDFWPHLSARNGSATGKLDLFMRNKLIKTEISMFRTANIENIVIVSAGRRLPSTLPPPGSPAPWHGGAVTQQTDGQVNRHRPPYWESAEVEESESGRVTTETYLVAETVVWVKHCPKGASVSSFSSSSLPSSLRRKRRAPRHNTSGIWRCSVGRSLGSWLWFGSPKND